MNEDELTQEDVDVTIQNAQKVILKGYRIALTRHSKVKRKGGVLDIISSPLDTVEGVLYAVPDEDKPKIEEKEGVSRGAYQEIPKPLDVETESRDIIRDVTSYEVCNKGNPPPASEEYKNSVLRGAREHGLSKAYREKLKAVLEKREK